MKPTPWFPTSHRARFTISQLQRPKNTLMAADTKVGVFLFPFPRSYLKELQRKHSSRYAKLTMTTNLRLETHPQNTEMHSLKSVSPGQQIPPGALRLRELLSFISEEKRRYISRFRATTSIPLFLESSHCTISFPPPLTSTILMNKKTKQKNPANNNFASRS